MTANIDRDTVEEVVEQDLVPTDGEDPAFDAPWQARVFAIAIALYDLDDPAEWTEFQQYLVDRIQSVDNEAMQRDVENVYYREWIGSLEEVLLDEGVLTQTEIDRRKEAFSNGERDAAEFVVGDPDH